MIGEGQNLTVNYQIDGSPIRLTFRTRYLDRGYTAKAPGDLWLDAEGEAKNLNSAAAVFTGCGREIAAILAVCANAAILDLEPEIIYESTPGLHEREFFQRHLTAEPLAYTSRFLDLEASTAFIQAVAESPHRDRLIRTILQYSQALTLCRAGQGLLCVSHLWMGVEALKTAAWRHECSSLEITSADLGERWGYRPDGTLSLAKFLDQEARVRLIYRGDSTAHKAAKDASDKFEHGFAHPGTLHSLASSTLIQTADYLRSAIIAISDLADPAADKLLGGDYRRPRGPTGTETYVRGILQGSGDELASAENEYPHLEWQYRVKDLVFEEAERKYSFSPDHIFTAKLAEGVSFTPSGVEVYDGSFFELFSRD